MMIIMVFSNKRLRVRYVVMEPIDATTDELSSRTSERGNRVCLSVRLVVVVVGVADGYIDAHDGCSERGGAAVEWQGH